ncbi:MAG: group II intron maturase-specific domain-containing protein [Bacteroidota bacterium]|nr:group II intron maturase-specific domain-containing protein [Bacteroidota bacterium]
MAISSGAQKKIVEEINWFKIHKWSESTIEDIADALYSKLQGWISYYGKFRKWVFLNVFQRLTFRLVKWVQNKYRITSLNRGHQWLVNYQRLHPKLFAHWSFGYKE